MKLLTKSLYLDGLQCLKLLWIKANSPEDLPQVSETAKARFKSGEEIGIFAQKVYPEGASAYSESYPEGIMKTEELFATRRTIFEASFQVDGLFSRADILVPVGEYEWDVIEVKSSTRVKDVHIEDLAFQKHVYTKKGLSIRKCFLMHINNQYVKKGPIVADELFILSDLSEQVEDIITKVPKRIAEMKEVAKMKECPDIKIGVHCSSPYNCPLMYKCWDFLPKESVVELYREKKRAFELLKEGIELLKDIPEDYKLNSKQIIQRKAAQDGKDFVNKKNVKKFLDELKYPVYYLDFETINPAIPLFDEMKPYQRIGFQYSLHVQGRPNGPTKHISFLASGREDPRGNFLKSLRDNLGENGDILVFNESFEKGVLQEHVLAKEGFDDWLGNILPRIKDLIIPFRNFDFYSAKQKGSCSIKAILPVFSDLDYSALDIGKGDLASLEFERVTYSDIPNLEREMVREALEKYCELDTLAEVKIIEGLMKMVEN
ncbi:MAG: DUF2779 domain-containing protein [Nanoarchaeota archaeon]|jgi:hypothetical protein|nr:DUF2779 domain-containing protein [Nanoarchaeota archaeon]